MVPRPRSVPKDRDFHGPGRSGPPSWPACPTLDLAGSAKPSLGLLTRCHGDLLGTEVATVRGCCSGHPPTQAPQFLVPLCLDGIDLVPPWLLRDSAFIECLARKAWVRPQVGKPATHSARCQVASAFWACSSPAHQLRTG